MSRPAAAPIVLLAALAVAGGCSGFGSSPSAPSAPTVTPAPVPEGSPGTETSAGGARPPGVTRDRVDAAALAQAHGDAANPRSFVWTLETVEVRETRPLSVVRRIERIRVRRLDPYRYNATTVRTWSGDALNVTRTDANYGDGRYRYRRIGGNETPEYRRVPNRVGAAGEGRYVDRAEGVVERYLAVGNATATVVDRDGRRVVRLVGTDSRRIDAEHYRVVALIAPSGLVRELRVRYVTREAGLEALVRVRMRYERVGSAEVSAPPWYDAARRATGDADATANETGTADESENRTAPSTASPTGP